MKRKVALVACGALLLAFSSCVPPPKADGVYTAQADDAHMAGIGYGWRDVLVVTYRNGEVTGAVFESYNRRGEKKSKILTHETTPPPGEWIAKLNENLSGAKTCAEVDTIAGATLSCHNARLLFEAIEQQGSPGETLELYLKPPPL